MTSQTFNSFWHGSKLSWLEWACIESFVRRGHTFRLFSYEDLAQLEVPPGVIKADAAEILPRNEVFEFDRSFSGFSNIFRYALLLQQGGWWVDADVYCQVDSFPDCRYAWASEDEQFINGAILKFPVGDPTLADILKAAVRIGRKVQVWGQLGPRLLTCFLFDWPDQLYGSTRDFYPVPWRDTHRLWLPEDHASVAAACAESPFVHMWASVLSRLGIDRTAAPPLDSFLHRLYAASSYPHPLARQDEASVRRSIEVKVSEWGDGAAEVPDRGTAALNACEVRSTYDPARAEITVTMASPLDDIRHVELFLNDRPEDLELDQWKQIGRAATDARHVTAVFDLKPHRLRGGVYRLGVNAHLGSGSVLYWYQQPAVLVRLMPVSAS